MQTYDRDEILKVLVQHYLRSHLVDRLIIIWNNVERKPTFSADMFTLLSGQELIITEQEKNSLNNRFLVPQELIRTDAVIVIDDDIHVELDQLESAFQIWKQYPRKLVSFHMRYIQQNVAWPFPCDYADKRKPNESVYSWYYRYAPHCYYPNGTQVTFFDNEQDVRPILLIGTTFFHKSFMSMYNEQVPKSLITMVDELMNGEDILFSMMHAYYTRELPLFVYSKPGHQSVKTLKNEKGHFAGLSNNAANHLKKRTECISRIVQTLGEMPLSKNALSASVP
jgi:hypothetical protein